MQASARICGRSAAGSMTAKCRLKSSQYALIIPHMVLQLTTISFWIPETIKAVPPTSQQNLKNTSEASEVPSDIVIYFLSFFLIYRRVLCSQPIRGKVRRNGRIFPEHVERSFLDPEYSFVVVRRIPRTRFAKQKFAQLRTNYVRRIFFRFDENPELCSRSKCSPNKERA